MNIFMRILLCFVMLVVSVVAAVAVQDFIGGRYSNSLTGLVGAIAGFATWRLTGGKKAV